MHGRYRLLPIVLGIPLLPVGLFVYGWTTEYKVHWMVPIVSSGFIGAGLIFTFVSKTHSCPTDHPRKTLMKSSCLHKYT
jgi:hypothetical protein